MPGDDRQCGVAQVEERAVHFRSFVNFEREVSVVAARSADGKVECFEGDRERAPRPHSENLARCRRQGIASALATEARRIATRIAKAFDYVGVLAVEMFVVNEGNEAGGAGQRDRPARA